MKRKIYYPKRVPLFRLVDKIKLWPSRQGVLHGIKTFRATGEYHAYVITHCGEEMVIRNSKNSHAARWLRNKWFSGTCEKCKVPEWKIEKYSRTVFKDGRAISSFVYKQPEKQKKTG
jgi:pyrrolysyl-tRNA synthetase-like protein